MKAPKQGHCRVHVDQRQRQGSLCWYIWSGGAVGPQSGACQLMQGQLFSQTTTHQAKIASAECFVRPQASAPCCLFLVGVPVAAASVSVALLSTVPDKTRRNMPQSLMNMLHGPARAPLGTTGMHGNNWACRKTGNCDKRNFGVARRLSASVGNICHVRRGV